MKGFNLNELKCLEAWHEEDTHARWTVNMATAENFPFWSGVKSDDFSVVYFELNQGNYLGEHTDSAEEVVLILEGEAEVSIGEEQVEAKAGQVIIIPEMVPHKIKNIGTGKVRCVGVFSKDDVTSTFTHTVLPLNERQFS
ncbi:cupin domain-containing protein [Filobacillus milosensis]|uniref:Cupin domain-containing protein n=1 Tax=Filobacillus milosensis TaxID=94137 RepID=A0A4Y8IDY5_9BACI|nr:cupin domain-containing protein [Filobacillus milosensis]TFB14130.1 cupin domain-containing protein [Filobacillus milosensis]